MKYSWPRFVTDDHVNGVTYMFFRTHAKLAKLGGSNAPATRAHGVLSAAKQDAGAQIIVRGYP